MSATHDYVLALLLTRVRKAPADRVRACRAGAPKRGVPFEQAVVEDELATAGEVAGLQEAAGFLIAGDMLRACASCKVQVLAPSGSVAVCGRCQQPLMRGVLPAPAEIQSDANLDRQVRRILTDAAARSRTQEQVAQANRLRSEGKLAQRPEGELAPREKAVAESRLGHYKLLSLTGRGSTSFVYKAEDDRDGRTVALKVLYFHPNEAPSAVEEKLARFRREAELASKLEHPHLVTVGPLEQAGAWYHIAMAYVGGPSLAQLLEARRPAGESSPSASKAPAPPPPPGGLKEEPKGPVSVPDERMLGLALVDIARGLHYAHCQGVIHRDVNPRNILFSETGVPMLSDFGTARPLGTGSQLTGRGVVLGTVEYAAPERLDSESRASTKSDVYSLGVVLYEILAGRRPFDAPKPEDLAMQIMRYKPAAPSSLNPTVTPALEAVAMRALEKDPAKRQGSALEFAEQLSAALLDEGGETAAGDGAAATGGRRMSVAALAVAFLLGVLVLSPFVGGSGPDRAAIRKALEARHDEAVAAKEPADAKRALQSFADAVRGAEQHLPDGDADLAYWRARLGWLRGDLEATRTAFDRSRGASAHERLARVQHGVAAYLASERYDTAALSGPYLAAARANFESLAREAASAWEGKFGAGMLVALRGDVDGATATLQEAIEGCGGRPEPRLVLGWLRLRQGKGEQASKYLHGLDTEFPNDPFARFARAVAYRVSGRNADAVESLTRLLQRWPDMLEAQLFHARILLEANKAADALPILSRAALRVPEIPEVHRLHARAWLGTGNVYEAVASLSRVLVLDSEASGALMERALLFVKQGDRTRAKADLEAYVKTYPTGKHLERAKKELQKL